MSEAKQWTDEQVKESARHWQDIAIGHANMPLIDYIEAGMHEVRNDLQARIAQLEAANAQLQQQLAAGDEQALDMPDSPGWWAFEGGWWESKSVVCDKNDPEVVGRHWNEDEDGCYYFKYEDFIGNTFRAVLEVKYIHEGRGIRGRWRSGPHHGEPVLGFVPHNRQDWSIDTYALDMIFGKWYRLTMPWGRRKEQEAQRGE